MAVSNRDRVGRALETLNKGLFPFIEREMKASHGARWLDVAQQSLGDVRHQQYQKDGPKWDTQAILTVMWDNWNTVFKQILGQSERSLVNEIKQHRNRWAHQEPFTIDDTYRAVDSIGRLLIAVAAAEEAAEMERQKNEVLRIKFDEQRKKEEVKATVAPLEGTPIAGLKSWREVISPHPDVASGRYQQAEFAADLGMVHRGEGSSEYVDPIEFFSRTHMTAGLKDLLSSAIVRINGKGGEPVVELQTSFGGGKTHSLLALYHAFSGVKASELAGLEGVVHDLDGLQPKKARKAVLVGTALNAAKPRIKEDGTKVHTLWGELAWQLLGKDGYKLIKENDECGASPGSDLLRELFTKAGPSLILLDELVVFMRQLYHKADMVAGSFDTNLSFIQSLTEAAQGVKDTLVVISLPASDTAASSTVEVGGEAGGESLSRLQAICFRVAKPWRPASAEESFEIVRRRLFQELDAPNFAVRDAVCRAFVTAYKNQKAEFPSGCGESEYERRMKSAYPIHPELFDRLFNDWSTLDKFQRTRGVLRLMASVISSLWQRNDAGLLIMPAFIPVDDPDVNAQLIRYLEDPWAPVIDKDIDGPNSLPLQLDKANTNYGKYSACRRVARTLFMGSAATSQMSNKGLEVTRIKLGCFQPGETVATFGDALRKLTDSATHLYVDGARYWYSVQPSVNRLAEDRANQADKFAVQDEIMRRLNGIRRADKKDKNFVSIHVPADSSDVPDEYGIKLVILGSEYSHATKDEESQARQKALEILQKKGSSMRFYANTLIFAAPDRPRLPELDSAVRKYLAWKSIYEESQELELTPFQAKQAETKYRDSDRTVDLRIQETFIWILVPGQDRPSDDNKQPAIKWEDIKINAGDEPLPIRAWRKLKDAEMVVDQYAGTLLRSELDKIPLWRGNHVTVKQLVDDYAKYLYLQRVRDTEVILNTISNGIVSIAWSTDTFAYCDSYDEISGRYAGLQVGSIVTPSLSSNACVVKPEAALNQMDADKAKTQASLARATTTPSEGSRISSATASAHDSNSESSATTADRQAVALAADEKALPPTRFYGNVSIDAARLAREFGRVSDEVISHLAGIVGSKVELTLEINAKVPEGFPPHVVRTVLENCRTLKFTSNDFEKE